MPSYNETVGHCVADSLIAGGVIPVHTTSARIAAGQGLLLRGAVLAAGTDGKLKLLSQESSGASEVPYGILCDAVDAQEEAVAEVYVSGQFNSAALVTKGTYKLTAADVKVLRDGGIYIENGMTSKEGT